MGWKIWSDMNGRKEWHNTKTGRRIVLTQIGFLPKQKERDVQVECGIGKKGFKTKAKAMKFLQEKKKEHLY